MSSVLKRIVKGASIVFAMTLLNSIFGFLVRIILARNLTLSDFGFFYAVIAFFGLVGLLKNLGINQAIIKYIPEFKAQKSFDKIKTSILFAFIFSIVSSAIVGSLLLYFSSEISAGYFKDPNVNAVFRVFLIFFVVQLLVTSINSMFNAFQRPLLMSYSGVFINLAFLLLVFFSDGMNINRVVWYYNGVHITVLITNFVLLLNVFNIFKYKASPYLPVAKKLVPFGAASTASTVVSHTAIRIDTIFLTFFQNLETVGIYSAITPFRTIFKIAGSSISKIFFPLTSELYGEGRTDELKVTLDKIHRYIAFLVMPLAVIFFAYTEFIINTLFGPEFVEGANAARFVVLSALIRPIGIINVGTINGLGKPIKNTQIITITGISNILLNIILIPLWSYNGAALALLINRLILFWATNHVLYRLIAYKYNLFYVIRIIFIGIIMYASLVLMKMLFVDTSIWLMIVQYTVASLLGTAVYLGFSISLKAVSIKELSSIFKFFLRK